MLFAIEGVKTKPITSIPHQAEYSLWRSRLSDDEFLAVEEAINQKIAGREVNVASFLPGKEWKGTPYWPIYEKACVNDFDSSRKFFGLIVWYVMMNHPEAWSFGRYDVKGVAVEGMTYFRIDPK